jgi:uncharacterized protein YacL
MTRTSTVSNTIADDATTNTKDEAAAAVDESRYISGRQLALVHTGFLSSVLLVALDQTIVATALPKLASQFNALDQLTWVVSAYFCKYCYYGYLCEHVGS